jgi:2-isopropylmalate synthase
VTECNQLPIHPRHPYAGELVFTAFSGSHQDAIKKGFEVRNGQLTKAEGGEPGWDMPYLPIDPADVGGTYEAVIRVNSQSGKGGIAYIVKSHLGLDLPRRMQVAFYQVIQKRSEETGLELSVADITSTFASTYAVPPHATPRLFLRSFRLVDPSSPSASGLASPDEPGPDDSEISDRRRSIVARVSIDGISVVLTGEGNGPLSSLLNALKAHLDIDLSVREYSEHAVDAAGGGSETNAASYVELIGPDIDPRDKARQGFWGVGIDGDITGSGLRAVLSAASNALGERKVDLSKLMTKASAGKA